MKSSINHLTELFVQEKVSSQSPSSSLYQLIFNHSFSLFNRFRQFFNIFKSSSQSNKDLINEQCCRILEYNNLTKQNLLSIYHLFDKNETMFLNWLRTLMPDYMLPLLLNYVKYFDSLPSSDNN